MTTRSPACAALALVALTLAAPPALADPPAFPEFTFKRVSAPKKGTVGRIDIQIEPAPERPAAPPPAAADADPDGEGTPPQKGAYAWFWNKVSPGLSGASPARLEHAVAQLTKGPGVPTPRLAHIQKIARTYGAEILAATINTRVSPALVLAVIGIESSGRAGAVSVKGATGLMQLMPDTAARFGTTDLTDPGQNIRGGVAYLDWLMEEFGGDPLLVLAAYNAGEGAVRRNDGVPPYDETRAYVPKVLAAWTVARGLCTTPPMFISDGCALSLPAAAR